MAALHQHLLRAAHATVAAPERNQAATLASLMNDHDPRPLPPEKPLPGDCCDGGCDNCVLTVYSEELDEYKQALAAWRERHPDAATDA